MSQPPRASAPPKRARPKPAGPAAAPPENAGPKDAGAKPAGPKPAGAASREPALRLVEVVDADNRPVAGLPLEEVYRQRLPHRSVVALLFNGENKIYLQRRSSRKARLPGRWDVSARTRVRLGESALDAAARALQDELRIQTDRLRLVRELPPAPDSDPGFLSVFSMGRSPLAPDPNPDEVEEGFFYSADELACLVREFRELLTPGLVGLWQLGMPFPTLDHG
ncbi:MAG: NUDIX domain-containing protein [Desulfovibrionaceae bacterium]